MRATSGLSTFVVARSEFFGINLRRPLQESRIQDLAQEVLG